MKKGPSNEQKRLMKEFRDCTCFEFMGHDEVSADDPQKFIWLWNKNIQWLRDMTTDTDRLATSYMTKHAV